VPYDLNLLRAFLALLEERSVTRAARRLGVTQPALSNMLGRLRELLGDPLFVRERYGMRPTEKAVELGPAVAAALAQLDRAVLGQPAFDPATSEHRFVIAANSYVEFVILPPLVAELRRRAPGVALRVVPFGGDLDEGENEAALTLGRIVDPPAGLIVRTLTEDGLACVVRADHPAASGLTRAKFESLKHVNVLPPGRLRAGLFQALERHGLRRDVVVSVTHFLSIPDLIAATDYCTTLPRRICERLASDPRLKVLARRSISAPSPCRWRGTPGTGASRRTGGCGRSSPPWRAGCRLCCARELA
jgi:DNA-binding transcriptional LysR family regulator